MNNNVHYTHPAVDQRQKAGRPPAARLSGRVDAACYPVRPTNRLDQSWAAKTSVKKLPMLPASNSVT